MAKVEMSLREYDELREELNLYKRALKEICTPEVSDWELSWYKENPDRSMTIRSKEISGSVQDLMKGIIYASMPDELRGLGNIEYIIQSTLFYLTHPVEDEVESNA